MTTKISGASAQGPQVGRGAGHFCWADIGALSTAKSKQFYGAVFNWQAHDLPLDEWGGNPGTFYTVFQSSGREAAGLYELSLDQRNQKVPPHWLSYVAVEDCEASVARAKELGGAIVVNAFEIREFGRMAMLLDPAGALFALWEEKSHPGSSLEEGAVGSLSWCELMTPDVEKSAHFYASLFDWEVRVLEGKGMRHAHCHAKDGTQICDFMEINSQHSRVPPHWLPYFAVESCTSASTRVEAAQGRILVKPSLLQDGATFAIVRDPEGAVFGLIEPFAE